MRKRFLGPVAAAVAAILLAGCIDLNTAGKDAAITLLAIPGVTAPMSGESPVTSIDASQYTGVISWSPAVSGGFADDTVYTATLTLTPKAGYTLTGLAANSFTVAGAAATQSAGSAVVTAAFTSTYHDLAPGGTVTVSSEQASYPRANLIDGNADTVWSANSDGTAWFSVDLGWYATIKAIRLYPDFDHALGNGTLTFSIEGSEDGSTWVGIQANASCDVITYDKASTSITPNSYTLTGLESLVPQYRYLKVTTSSWKGWPAVFELQVYGYMQAG